MQDKKKNKQQSFFKDVFNIVREIPEGRVSTYGAIANALGTGTARMVGWAMNQSFDEEPEVPAHRVLNRNGELTGRHHFNPPSRMQKLLEEEGIEIKNSKVVNFKSIFWNPAEELLEE